MPVEILEDLYDRDRPPLPDNILPPVDPGSEEFAQEKNLAERFSVMSADSMIDQEIASMVTDRKKSVETHRQQKKTIWDKCWDHVRQVYDKTGKEAWQSTVFQPDTPKVVEVITANLAAAILGPQVPIEWQCKIKEYEQNIRDTNDILKNDFERSKFKTHFTDFLRALSIVGTSIGKIGYALQEDIVMVKERPKTSMIERAISAALRRPIEEKPESYTPQRMLVKDWSTFEYRDIYNIYPEPFTTEISKDHWIIEESRITNRELVDLANHPDEFFRIKNVTPEMLNRSGTHDVQEDPELAARRWALQQQSTNMIYFDPDTPHQLLEYWGPVPLWMVRPEARNDEEAKYTVVNGWIWVIDGQWVVRSVLNPNRDGEPPYVKGTYIQIPNDWYGIGASELMLGLQINKNEMVNTKTDNVNLMLNKVLAVLKDKVPGEFWDRLESAPGNIWPFEGIDDIRRVIMPVEFPNLIRDIYLGIEIIDRAIEETTGAVKATIGAGGSASEVGGGTYRGQLLNRQMASERFMLYARTLEASSLGAAYKKMYHRIYQYKSYEGVGEIIGKDRARNFEFIPPEKIEQFARIVPLGVMTMETKGMKLAEMIQYAKIWTGKPWFKEYDFARKMWIEMGHSDPDSVIFSQEEMSAFNEFRKSLLPQAGGGPGGPSPGPMEPGVSGAGVPPGPLPPPGEGPGPLPPVPGGLVE